MRKACPNLVAGGNAVQRGNVCGRAAGLCTASYLVSKINEQHVGGQENRSGKIFAELREVRGRDNSNSG